jgi:predicted DNA-binding helix-hairpin-helix protein
VREHRLYQADWLMRFYGFAHEEIVAGTDGMLSLDVDPKLAWALAHRERFPVDLNRAPEEMLLRVPGLGIKAVARMLQARRVRRLRSSDLERLRVPLAKVLPFVEVDDHRPGKALEGDALRRLVSGVAGALDGESLRSVVTRAAAPRQATLFDEPGAAPTPAER